MKEVDITKECEVGLEFYPNGEALIYLYRNKFATGKEKKKIGLFDRHGFHFMDDYGIRETYRVEDGFRTPVGITWFKVLEKR